jgi:heme exporter protein C
MTPLRPTIGWTYWLVAFGALLGGVVLATFYAPTSPSAGPVEKALYIHVPAAVSTLLICLVVFIANIAYIWQRTEIWDDLAEAGAQVAVLLASVVLVTGMAWARHVWGAWWVWSPLLTFSLILWALYVAYLGIHAAIPHPSRRALACAMYGAIAFLDVPLLYLSLKLLPDRHPSDFHLLPRQVTTLIYWFLPATMFWVGLVFVLFRQAVRTRTSAAAPAADSDRIVVKIRSAGSVAKPR